MSCCSSSLCFFGLAPQLLLWPSIIHCMDTDSSSAMFAVQQHSRNCVPSSPLVAHACARRILYVIYGASDGPPTLLERRLRWLRPCPVSPTITPPPFSSLPPPSLRHLHGLAPGSLPHRTWPVLVRPLSAGEPVGLPRARRRDSGHAVPERGCTDSGAAFLLLLWFLGVCTYIRTLFRFGFASPHLE